MYGFVLDRDDDDDHGSEGDTGYPLLSSGALSLQTLREIHSSLNADGYHLMLGADYRSVCICPAKSYLST